MTKTIAIEDAVPLLGADWFDPLETGGRQQIRVFTSTLNIAPAEQILDLVAWADKLTSGDDCHRQFPPTSRRLFSLD